MLHYRCRWSLNDTAEQWCADDDLVVPHSVDDDVAATCRWCCCHVMLTKMTTTTCSTTTSSYNDLIGTVTSSSCCIKVYGYSSSQSNLPHHYRNSHIGSLPPDRGDIPAFTPAKAGTRLSDPRGMQGWVDLVGWLHTGTVYSPEDGHPSRY